MLIALVLVCAIGAEADLDQCNQESASDVIVVPATFASPPACFFAGQAYLAGSSVGQFDTRIYRAKVMCIPEQAGRELAKARRTRPKARGLS